MIRNEFLPQQKAEIAIANYEAVPTSYVYAIFVAQQ